ncbi:uncharacterized protein LOC129964169 isoform X2 [Argiope bruennichi]|nr:uncharacterized protein LOC129964169 isoform X2 [Argiope bruennichi]XP_055934855.1 uncharacterized protein LOC129964169 isoform X2 [Argiope bruennichi]
MTNSLLKTSSSWFLRPPHLKQNAFENGFSSNKHSEIHIFLPPDEEYSIRKYCPLTLNHLLPDLRHSTKEQEEDATAEFDTIMLNKFEKHLEESHPIISGSSSEDEPVERTEDALPLVESIKKPDKEKFRMKILLPNKVNYPQENMKLLLPDVVLNNKRLSSPILTKNFCTGCINRGMTLTNTNVCKKNTFAKRKNIEQFELRGSNQRFYKDSITFPSVTENSPTSKDNLKSTFCHRNIQENESADHKKELMNNLNLPMANLTDMNFPQCRYHHKNNFNSSSGKWNISTDAESRPKSPLETIAADAIPLSPYMMELARLRKEKLKIEEKMLLKRRQALELERLRPPVDKWYEMKDHHFHHEAHRNNVYVKNQNILPLIEDRRRLLHETIAVGKYTVKK